MTEPDSDLKELVGWMTRTFFQGIYYSPYNATTGDSLLGIETVLYSVHLGSSFLKSMIDGAIPPAQFKYIRLVETLYSLAGQETCHWFHVIDPDNCLSMLRYMKDLQIGETYSTSYTDLLELLEREEAPQGGKSYLLLVGAKGKWLLHHEYEPNESFTISLHGPAELSERLVSKLGIKKVKDLRAPP